jgi:hypothetical protein
VVALLLVLRRPVLDVTSAEVMTGTPVLGRLVIGGSRRASRGLPQLCRRILRQRVDTVLLTGPRETSRIRKLLAAELAEMLDETLELVRPEGEPPEAQGAPLRIVEEPSPLDLATRADTSLVLVVVKEGIAAAQLRRQAEQFLDGGPAGLVLVRTSVSLRPWRSRSRSEPKQPPATPSSEQQATTSSISE